MLRVLPAELTEELSAAQLQVAGQLGCEEVHLFELDPGFAGRVDLVNQVGEAPEIRVYRSVERELRIRYGEPAHPRVVIAELQGGDVGLGGPAEIGQAIEPDVHVGPAGARGRSCALAGRLSQAVETGLERLNQRPEGIRKPRAADQSH